MRYFLTYCVTIFVVNYGLNQIVRTKDGISLGQRKDFISSCIKGAAASTMSIKGIEFNTSNYCICVCDNLIPTLYEHELENAVKTNDSEGLFIKDKNLNIIIKCLDGNFKINDDFKVDNDQSENDNDVAIKACIKEFLKDSNNSDTNSLLLAKEYCTCAINKLFSNGYTYKEFLELRNENSLVYNEIAVPCVNEILKYQSQYLSTNNKYNSFDIYGSNFLSKITLLDYLGQGFKIKISIDGITKYYLFDTGASDLIINRDLEQELQMNGSLKKENYFDKKYYILANNQKIIVDMAILQHVKIGDYIVNNVKVAIIDKGSLLCGKGFLDKFRKWDLDKENKLLILYR